MSKKGMGKMMQQMQGMMPPSGGMPPGGMPGGFGDLK